MEVIQAAVHLINKAAHSEEATVVPAVGQLTLSAELTRVTSEILETFNTRCSQQSGVFQADEENYPFASWIREYFEDARSFYDMTVSATGRLAALMRNQKASTGGHLLFVHYRRNQEDYLLVVKLLSAKGSMFDGDMANVRDAVHLNLHTLQVAARINRSAWADGAAIRYLSFVCKRELGHPANYFRDFIGCNVQSEARTESKKLAAVVNDFCDEKVAALEMTEEGKVATMRQVFDYAVARIKARETVNLNAVAALAWPNEAEVFTTFLNGHQSPPTDEFNADRNSLRRLADYVFTSKDFKLSMSHLFKTAHRVRVENGILLIENPPGQLAEELAD